MLESRIDPNVTWSFTGCVRVGGCQQHEQRNGSKFSLLHLWRSVASLRIRDRILHHLVDTIVALLLVGQAFPRLFLVEIQVTI